MITTGKVVALIKAMGGGADPAAIEAAVQDWLDAHPEATTTVQDGSITEQKLATSIAQKLGLISSLSDEIGDVKSAINIDSDFYMSEIINGDNEYNFVNYPGYLGTNGSIASQTANKEVTTNKIRVIEGQSLSVRLDYESSKQYWLVYGRYDANGNWLGRTDLKTSGSGTTYSTTIDVPSGVGYVRFSYRTYDVSTFSVKTISTYNGALSYLETGNMLIMVLLNLGFLIQRQV